MRLPIATGLLIAALAGPAGAADGVGKSLADAAQKRDRDAVKALVTRHADVNAVSADGTSPLHWAAYFGDLEMASLLIGAGADVQAKNRYGATPLWLAASTANPAVVAALLKAGADPNMLAVEGEPPLLAAARAGSGDAVSLLLTQGADVNARDRWRGQTALMWAAGGDEPHPEVVKLLIAQGADVNIRSLGIVEGAAPGQAARTGAAASVPGLTALLFAVRQNDLESTKLLIAAGANINDKGPGGAPPLFVAINNSHYSLARFLLDNKADANVTDGTGSTALHVIVRKRASRRAGVETPTEGGGSTEVLKALLAHGTAVNARTPTRPRVKRLNPSSRPDIDDVEYAAVSAFWLAANGADLEAMRILFQAGADPKLNSMEDTTPLMVAAGLGYGTVGALGRRVDTQEAAIAAVAQLLAWGNDVNAVNKNGQTALHGAASAAAPLVVKYLAEHGAVVGRKDAVGRTPLQVADDNRTDKYRSNQDLDPLQLEPTYALLLRLSGETEAR